MGNYNGSVFMSTMSNSLDVHVLYLPTNNKVWFEQALDSIEKAKSRCSLDVNVFVLEGVRGHIGRGREAGYALGTGQYVTYVDHDDYIKEDALCTIEPFLREEYTAVFPGETIVDAEGTVLREALRPHHLCVYKRACMPPIDFSAYPLDVDLQIIRAFTGKGAVAIQKSLYFWRRHKDSATTKGLR